MQQWIPLSPTHQPRHPTHMFPIMVGTFQALPSIPQERAIAYRARSDTTQINHTEETRWDLLVCGIEANEGTGFKCAG